MTSWLRQDVPKTLVKRKLRPCSRYFPQNTLILTESREEFSDLHSILDFVRFAMTPNLPESGAGGRRLQKKNDVTSGLNWAPQLVSQGEKMAFRLLKISLCLWTISFVSVYNEDGKHAEGSWRSVSRPPASLVEDCCFSKDTVQVSWYFGVIGLFNFVRFIITNYCRCF